MLTTTNTYRSTCVVDICEISKLVYSFIFRYKCTQKQNLIDEKRNEKRELECM